MIRQQAPAADAEFRIAFCRANAVDQLDAGPDAAGILPAAADPPSHSPRMARAATSRRSCSSSASRECSDLAGGAHAHGDQAGQKVGGNRQARAFGDVVHPADDLDAMAGPAGEARQQIGERLGGAFHARRDDAGGDHRRFEQAQVVAGEIEDFGDAK